jgi:hypothetical protein
MHASDFGHDTPDSGRPLGSGVDWIVHPHPETTAPASTTTTNATPARNRMATLLRPASKSTTGRLYAWPGARSNRRDIPQVEHHLVAEVAAEQAAVGCGLERRQLGPVAAHGRELALVGGVVEAPDVQA